MSDVSRVQVPQLAERAGAAVWNAIRLRPRVALIGALAVAAVGLALNWSWLVAAGVAPILLAIAPCAVMCALGLCMNRLTGQTCATETHGQNTANPAADSERSLALEAPAATDPIAQPRNFEDQRVPHA